MRGVDIEDIVTPATASTDDVRRPSTLWAVLGIACALGAVLAVVGALVLNARAQRPIGEGELFRDEAEIAAAALDAEIAPDDLKRIRNDLAIESVALLDGDVLVASTSQTRIGTSLESSLVAGFAAAERFGAAAVTLADTIELDGVVEWMPGDVVYEVVQPLGGGRSLLLTYDISELLARRSSARTVPATAIELLVAAALLMVMTVGLFVARSRALRTYREIRLESSFLRREALALATHNRELDEARERAERAYELAEEKNRIRSEFVLMINHELRTPLTGVVTGAELLAASGAVDDPTWTDVIDDMVRNGTRLREMIDQILAVARIENRALSFDLEDVSLSDVLGGLAARNHHVALHGDVGERLAIRTDRSSLMSLIESIAANAMTHGASDVAISVARHLPFDPLLQTAPPPEPALFFLIEDDGPGIDPEFLPRAFEKFEKDSWSSGTGLGLYIARVVVEALDGSIAVTTSSLGTTFAVAVPVVESAEVSV